MTVKRFIKKVSPRQSHAGSTLVELALILPILVLMILAAVQYGWLMMSMNMLTSATAAGVQVLSTERGFSTPHTDTLNQIYAAAPALSRTDMTVTLLIDSSVCTSDDSCALALSASQGKAATLSLSYQYTPIIAEVISMGLPSTLSVSMTGRIQ